ncbi:exoribonuclease family protein [Aspergillus uvarum CBS 121591]|uniref:Exoribonuclease family protein n=1 Tax=Aspergillus uvarum CBS 121591 TaxID=1448315 RepID=A0A319CNK0_9EURO|nr:exoribonuclease family protein [Aspergillus uvarum CBS 121591]PYH86009.1 exoribonuclease family protein [Aspergillus uvarum CBS 121591]
MTDRRRINGPPSGTRPAVFASSLKSASGAATERPRRHRQSNELRKIFLKTGLIPSASGSAYLEYEPSASLAAARSSPQSLIPPSSALKLACTVHGPKPLPRSATFSPNLVLTTHVKYAPFAARQRKGHIRDSSERDLGVHLETALRGVIVAERWPKSGLDITITILEAEDDRWWGDAPDSHDAPWGMMNVLAGCITAASAAIADARIDCLDLVAGGVAAIVSDDEAAAEEGNSSTPKLMLDTDPAEHKSILSACVVAYMPARDEITEIWLKGDHSKASLGVDDSSLGHEALIDGAVNAARGAHTVLVDAVRESAERYAGLSTSDS